MQEQGACPYSHDGSPSFYRTGFRILGPCLLATSKSCHALTPQQWLREGLCLTRDPPSLALGECLVTFSPGEPHCLLLSCSVPVQESLGSRVGLRGCSVGNSHLSCLQHRMQVLSWGLMSIANPFHRKLGEPLPLGPDCPQSDRLFLSCAEVLVYLCWELSQTLVCVSCVRLCDSELKEMRGGETWAPLLRSLPHTFLSLM